MVLLGPGLAETAGRNEGRIVMNNGNVADGDRGILHEAELRMLRELRELRQRFRRNLKDPAVEDELTLGQRIADQVACGMGSWRFIIVQSVLLSVWVALNLTAWIKAWDPYPFILLNLALSFQAAYAAPIIMMAQNRQQDIDRKAAESD